MSITLTFFTRLPLMHAQVPIQSFALDHGICIVACFTTVCSSDLGPPVPIDTTHCAIAAIATDLPRIKRAECGSIQGVSALFAHRQQISAFVIGAGILRAKDELAIKLLDELKIDYSQHVSTKGKQPCYIFCLQLVR
jgi:hypothetical protein